MFYWQNYIWYSRFKVCIDWLISFWYEVFLCRKSRIYKIHFEIHRTWSAVFDLFEMNLVKPVMREMFWSHADIFWWFSITVSVIGSLVWVYIMDARIYFLMSLTNNSKNIKYGRAGLTTTVSPNCLLNHNSTYCQLYIWFSEIITCLSVKDYLSELYQWQLRGNI